MLNLVYTGVQILHNFGAVAVVGSPAVAWWFARDNLAAQCRLAWILVIGWAAQGVSGAGFGMTSYFLKGQLPEISGCPHCKDGVCHERLCYWNPLLEHSLPVVCCHSPEDVARHAGPGRNGPQRRCLSALVFISHARNGAEPRS